MTPMQKEFCRLYAQCGRIGEAARGAGYSEKYVDGKSHKLLENPDIVSEIKRLRERLNQRAEKSATDVVNEYAKVAFTDRTEFLKEDPENQGQLIYKAPHELTEDQKAIIEKVHVRDIWGNDSNGNRRFIRQEYNYTFMDKKDALQQMGRHFGIFDDKLRLQSTQTNPFRNATPAQLEQLKKSFVGIMTDRALIEGEYEVEDG